MRVYLVNGLCGKTPTQWISEIPVFESLLVLNYNHGHRIDFDRQYQITGFQKINRVNYDSLKSINNSKGFYIKVVDREDFNRMVRHEQENSDKLK